MGFDDRRVFAGLTCGLSIWWGNEARIGCRGCRVLFLGGGVFGEMRNEATILLQLAESGERFVEATLGGGHQPLHDRQHLGEGDHAGRGSFNGHEPRFAFAPAADAPELFGHFVDQDFFGGVGGLMIGAEIGFERVEFGGIFAGVDEGFRVETVLEGVAAAGGFPRRSDRTRTVLGIGAIGFGSRGGLGNWCGLILAGLFERLALGGSAELA